jgi:3-dehydroquinate synthase
MCTGKTQVGKRLAAALGMRFVDSDDVIEERAGKSIERIFAEDGEERFRQQERKAIAHLASKSGLVIATGGGALGDKRNLADLRRSGTLICLTTSPEEILQRARKGPARPLLKVANPRKRIEELLKLRAPRYAQADYHFDTTSQSPAKAAAQIARLLNTVSVQLGERSYEIIIGRNLLANAQEHISRLGRYGRPIVISEARVWGFHGESLAAGLPNHERIILPALEDQERLKTLRYAEHLYDELMRLQARRDSLIIAFGGGTVGDLVGFTASTYMRGLDFVQIPTTLLAQVDSSVGGKVAVNHPQAKNLIGAFWQPKLVLADLHCLDTLPRQEIRNGLAEMVKHAVLGDARLFRYMEDHVEDVLRLYPPAMQHLLWRNCQIKADVVSRDEREGGLRAVLNLGHTFGHALETASNYHGLGHGEAVSIGMAAAARLASNLGIFSESGMNRLLNLLQAYHLPALIPRIPVGTIFSAMKADKKALQEGLRFVLPERIGKVRLVSKIPPAEVKKALSQGKAKSSLAGKNATKR